MPNGTIMASLGLDKKNFRTGIEAAKDDLGIFKKAASETNGAIALLQRSMKETGGTDAQKRELADLTAAHKKYQREVRTTESQIKALSAATGGGGAGASGFFGGLKNLGSSLVGFSGIGAVLGSLGSIGGIASLGKELLSFAHDTRTAAESVNMDVEKFQRMRAVFGKNGADEEVFTHSIGKLTENIQSAKGGDVKKEESFAGLGVSFQDLNQLSPDQVLLKIADAAAHSTNPTKTFAEVIDVLGKSGMKMLPGLKLGGDAIEAMGDKAKVASRESIEAAEAAQKRFMAFTSRQTGATLEGAYRYYDAFRKADGAGGVGGLLKSDLLENHGPAEGSGSAAIESLRSIVARGPIGTLSRFTRGLYLRATGGSSDVGTAADADNGPGFDAAPGSAPAAAAAAPTFKGALDLKKDELALEERLRAIRRAGDDAEVKAAGAKLEAAREIIANAEKNPLTDELTRGGLQGKVGDAEESLRLAKRASAERKEEMADQTAINDLQAGGAAARLLALDQEEARLKRRLNSPEYGADEKAGFSAALGRNANEHRDARRAYFSEQDANIGLEIQNRHTGPGAAERVKLLNDQLADVNRRKGQETPGDVSPAAIGRWQRLNLEASAYKRELSDLLFGEKQTLETAKATTREMMLQGWGHEQAAKQAAIRSRAERDIATLAHNKAPAALIVERAAQRDIELNQSAAAEYQKTPEQRVAEADQTRAQVRAMNATNPNFHTRDADREGSGIRDADAVGGAAHDADKYGGMAYDANAWHAPGYLWADPASMGGVNNGLDPDAFAEALGGPLGEAMAAAFLEATANTEGGD